MTNLRNKIDGIKTIQSAPQKPAKVVLEKDYLSSGKRFQFALGLILPRDYKKTISIFTLGAMLLLSGAFAMKLAARGVETRKQILGIATTGLANLEDQDWTQARANFEQARSEIQNSHDTLIKILNFLPVGKDMDNLQIGRAHV